MSFLFYSKDLHARKTMFPLFSLFWPRFPCSAACRLSSGLGLQSTSGQVKKWFPKQRLQEPCNYSATIWIPAAVDLQCMEVFGLQCRPEVWSASHWVPTSLWLYSADYVYCKRCGFTVQLLGRARGGDLQWRENPGKLQAGTGIHKRVIKDLKGIPGWRRGISGKLIPGIPAGSQERDWDFYTV